METDVNGDWLWFNSSSEQTCLRSLVSQRPGCWAHGQDSKDQMSQKCYMILFGKTIIFSSYFLSYFDWYNHRFCPGHYIRLARWFPYSRLPSDAHDVPSLALGCSDRWHLVTRPGVIEEATWRPSFGSHTPFDRLTNSKSTTQLWDKGLFVCPTPNMSGLVNR